MPKPGSKESKADKSRSYIRRCLREDSPTLTFGQYNPKKPTIYKLNKHHYIDTNINMVDLQIIKFMVKTYKEPNRVESIEMELCELDEECMKYFVLGNWQNLKFLRINNNRIGQKGLCSLARNGKFQQLMHLCLADNHLNQESMKHLAGITWRKLQLLDLSFNPISSSGLKDWGAFKSRSLKQLRLLSCSINNRGIAHLVRLDLPRLQKLSLSNNLLTNDCTNALVRCQFLLLRFLDLDGNFITDSGLSRLANLSCTQIKTMQLFSTKTVAIDTTHTAGGRILPTLQGVAYLVKAPFDDLKVEVHKGGARYGPNRLIHNTKLTEMLFYAKRHVVFVK